MSENVQQTEYWKKLMKSTSVDNMVDLIKYPVITQKTYLGLVKNRQYTFDVDPKLNKIQLKKLFEKLFNVNIISINTHIPPRKKLRVGFTQGFRPLYKRIIITVKNDQFINFSEANI
uniref:Large ribosomal subunit protein uL23c n=1 Tax=Lobochlamys segnis TaxID=52035 RepID=A0A0S2IC27_9CHLO|nr:ribosomal protein L23 [Lobochlamys segnis]